MLFPRARRGAGLIRWRSGISWLAKALPFLERGGGIRPTESGALEVEVDLGVAGERQVVAGLRFGQYALVIWDVKPEFATVRDAAKAELLQRGGIWWTCDIGRANRWLGVGMPGPCGDPLGESECDIFRLSPLLEALRDLLRRGEEAGVERGACSFWEAVRLRPRIEQPVPVTQAECPATGLFQKALPDEVLNDAGDEARTSIGPGNNLTLRPEAIAIREQATDDACALAGEDVARLQLVAESASRMGFLTC